MCLGAVGALEEYLTLCELDDLDVTDQNGRTPLHLAAMGGHGEVVDILLNRGGEILSIKIFQIKNNSDKVIT